MQSITRLPALPLIVNDPYFSIWMAADALTDADASHWAGERKRLVGEAIIDGQRMRFLGLSDAPAMETRTLTVTPTSTKSSLHGGGVLLTVRFMTPLLLDDPDTLSTPITFVDFLVESDDGKPHDVSVKFSVFDDICYDGLERPEMMFDALKYGDLHVALTGQKRQNLLCHSGDHITIDWGYLYLASHEAVEIEADRLSVVKFLKATAEMPVSFSLMAAYDDVASINYFGVPTKAWYARCGKTIIDALIEFDRRHGELEDRCALIDEELLREARARGGDDYALIASAAYRHAIAAHKLIADENGEMVLLSKENDSNGCIGTVDVSYPSIPLFLKYNPEYVRALCRQVLRFARMPVWTYDFAPHDVGRYPHATGQVYGLRKRSEQGVDHAHGQRFENGDVYPPYFQYPADADVYDLAYQMPVEECGNMLVMLYVASYYDGKYDFIKKNMDLAEKWVEYLLEYGEDPNEQLCTDDFAGHLAHNVNLSAKAVMGVACFSRMLEKQGDRARAAEYMQKAQAMANSLVARSDMGGYTALTYTKQGWSMKYNLVWDKLLGFNLLPDSFYEAELNSYMDRINEYGLPLDSRQTYTKVDWILWIAAMVKDEAQFDRFIAPIAKFLRETTTRVPFSDWYDTVSGEYVHFIARSVVGGVFMPLL